MDQNRRDLEHLRSLCIESLPVKYPGGSRQAATELLNVELEIRDQAGFAKLLLIASDIGRFSQAEGIFCRLVPESCGSILAYLLGLSDVEPLRYQLPPGPVCESGEHGIPKLTFAVDPWHAKAVADFVHKRCEPDMVEEKISLPRLYIEAPTPYHLLDIACKEPGVADGRFLFHVAFQWELLPFLVAKAIQSRRNQQFDLTDVPLDDEPTFDLIQQGYDLEVSPPDWDEWNLRTVHVPKANRIEDIAVAYDNPRWQMVPAKPRFLSCKAVASAINTYQVVYLKTHYPQEFEAAIQQRWPSVPDDEGF